MIPDSFLMPTAVRVSWFSRNKRRDDAIGPLLEFYLRATNSQFENGYKVVALALVRKSDCTYFYSDLVKQWSDIDSVTGKHMIFAAVEQADPRVWSRLFRFNSKADAWLLDSNRQSGSPRAFSSLTGDVERLAAVNTTQMQEVKRHLSLKESDIPCIHLTLLSRCRGQHPTVTLPMQYFDKFSVYAICKYVIGQLETAFNVIDNLTQSEREALSALGMADSKQSQKLKQSLERREETGDAFSCAPTELNAASLNFSRR